MSCYKPIKAFRTPDGVVFQELRRHDIIGEIELPCGMCIGCRMRRASDWTIRVMHEAQMYDRNCFITLTYGRDSLPPESSLCHDDYQKFMKRLRKRTVDPVRFFMCGEYGPLNLRPHYHACLFGVDFREDRVESGKSNSGQPFYDSATLHRLWGHGRVSVQDLTRETAGYCARYIMKKQLGRDSDKHYESVDEEGVVHVRKPEYAAMSLKPGIGAAWFDKYGRDVYPHDYVIVDGKKLTPPKYYDKLSDRRDAEELEAVKMEREVKAMKNRENNTTERLKVREIVHEARIRNLKRGDLS